MINKKFLEKYQIFVYLLIIIFGLLAVRIRYGYKGELDSQAPIVTVTPQPTATPTSNQEAYPLQKELPYYGKGFVVEKYTAPLALSMKLNGATETQAVKDVTVWLNSFSEVKVQHKIVLEEVIPTVTLKK